MDSGPVSRPQAKWLAARLLYLLPFVFGFSVSSGNGLVPTIAVMCGPLIDCPPPPIIAPLNGGSGSLNAVCNLALLKARQMQAANGISDASVVRTWIPTSILPVFT